MSFLATTSKRKIPDIVKDFNEKYDGELIEKLTEERATEILSQDLFITPNTLEDEDNKRMQEQKGTFAFPANIIENETIVGIKDFQDDKSYQEIIIPFEFHDEIFSQLKDMNYSSKRLYGDTSKDLAVPVLKDLKSMVNGNFKKVTAPFSKRNEEIFTNVLLKKSEIEDLGYQIATERNVDMLTLWFKRNNTHSHDGVNILRQVWYQGSRRKCVDDGIKIGKFIKTDDWSDDFYIDRLLFTNSDVTSKRKILPPLENALKVKMKVDYAQNGKIRFHTNLFPGAKLFVTYNGLEDTITTKEGKQDYYIDVDKRVKRIIGDITLITPSLQTKEFLDRVGNDFENLIGDFIKRDDDSSSLISGHQKFNLSTISE